MAYEDKTLGELLSDARIRQIAPDAVTNMDLSKQEKWNQTLAELREIKFGGGLGRGFERLFAAADGGDWYYPLYTEAECREDEHKRGVSLVWLPSGDPAAADRPYILIVPGGGFVNVWNLTEGWPIAAQFNELGYNAFILTYRVGDMEGLLDLEMADMARALQFIRGHEQYFGVRGDRYVTCGFSAGGYLVCLWNTEKGYPAFDLPKPEAVFPVYPVTSCRQRIRDGHFDPRRTLRLYGCSMEEAAESAYEIPEHAEGFPPCALFLTAEDELVNPEHSRLLARALEALGIPCRLEIGPTGGHGFADGDGSCMEGWIERAVRWFEAL